MSTDLEREIADLRKRRDELSEVVVDTSREDGDRLTAVHASGAIEKKLLTLGTLRAKELAGETVSQPEIDEALGRVKPPEKPGRLWSDAQLRSLARFSASTQKQVFEETDKTFLEVKGYVDRELNALEQRLRVIEDRPSMKYCGVWDGSQQYNEGDFTTNDGGVWACLRSTRTQPGKSADWKLAVKGTR